MIVEPHQFQSRDLVAGNLALDFANTVTGRDVAPRDWLGSYAHLLDWARHCREFRANDLGKLRQIAGIDPDRATTALARATLFRESLCRAAYAILGEGTAKPDDYRTIEQTYKEGMNSARFEWSRAGCRMVWKVEFSGLALITHVIAVNAVSLFMNFQAGRIRICAGENCGWLFVDSSRSGRRRWCDMATCGNVAKARRYYRRHVQT